MSISYNLLHLEPTDVCQAACPQCAREADPSFNKAVHSHLTVAQVKTVIDEDAIRGLNKILMCGNYGDPAAGHHTLEIIDYFRSINPNIVLGMNTNGALQNPDWWTNLAKRFNQPKDYVVFSIDGLEDTNHIYRRNVVWTKLMHNAKAFIDGGGLAHWDMLVFEHNQHQVDACKKLACDMGFYFFRAKVSRRHNSIPVSFLKPPIGWRDPLIVHGKVQCSALEEGSAYINAKGVMFPCCWMDNTSGLPISKFQFIQDSWKTVPHPICQQTCCARDGRNSFTNQWQQEVNFV